MKTINASVNENRELVTDTVNGYSGDSNAEVLAVDLANFGDYDSYAVYIRTSTLGPVRRLEAGTDSSQNPYVKDGKMYISLSSDFTCGGKLGIELEGIKIQDGVTVRELTSVAQINFKPSMASAAEHGEYRGGAETELRLLAAALSKRLTDLEEREPVAAIGTVPYADENTVGGFKIDSTAPLKICKSGVVEFNYWGINFRHFIASGVASLLIDYETVTGEINEKPGDEALINMTSDVVDGIYDACVYTVCDNGTISYTNENYETVEMYAHISIMYLFRMENGVMTVTACQDGDLLKLLKKGVAFEE